MGLTKTPSFLIFILIISILCIVVQELYVIKRILISTNSDLQFEISHTRKETNPSFLIATPTLNEDAEKSVEKIASILEDKNIELAESPTTKNLRVQSTSAVIATNPNLKKHAGGSTPNQQNPEVEEDSVPPIGTYHFPPLEDLRNRQNLGLKVMLLITTQISSGHRWYLKTCWPPALNNSLLLRNSDVVVYMNPLEFEWKRKLGMDILKNTFQNQNLTIHVRDHQDKQAGAMAPLAEAKKAGWFNGYDWIIRVNPDVIIRDETFLLHTMQNDPNASGLLIDCHANVAANTKIHTDFFAIKPEVLPPEAFLSRKRNAEESFTHDIQESILNKGGHRWIPSADQERLICRAGHKKKLHETPITHTHFSTEEMKAFGNKCPIPF